MPDAAQSIIPNRTAVKRVDWTVARVEALLSAPFGDLIYQAQQIHRRHFAPNEGQLSTLLSIKTGGCPEDCSYCPRAARYHTGVENDTLMSADAVVERAGPAKRTWA